MLKIYAELLCFIDSNFVVGVGQSVALYRNILAAAYLLDVPFHNDVAVFFVQLNGVAGTVRLLTGNERAAGASNGSSTSVLLMELFIMGYASSAIGFMVGWSPFFLGLSYSQTVVSLRPAYHTCFPDFFQPNRTGS